LRIRDEEENDRPAVREIVAAEFDTGGEADLIDDLRAGADPLVSLVAEEGGAVVGHVMLSPVSLVEHPEAKLMGLAPLAVLYDRQGQGVGSALVRAGLDQCRKLHVAAVVALGHSEYYSRFGFVPASRFGLKCEYPVPDNAFMALELEPGALAEKSGTVRYHAAFGRF
jgi:putative acetyltransferase